MQSWSFHLSSFGHRPLSGVFVIEEASQSTVKHRVVRQESCSFSPLSIHVPISLTIEVFGRGSDSIVFQSLFFAFLFRFGVLPTVKFYYFIYDILRYRQFGSYEKSVLSRVSLVTTLGLYLSCRLLYPIGRCKSS